MNFMQETYSLKEQTLIDFGIKDKNLDYEKFIFTLENKGIETNKFKFNEFEFKKYINRERIRSTKNL